MRLPVTLHVVTVAVCAAALLASLQTAELEARAMDDPVARADLALARDLTPELVSREVDQALDAGDLELVASLAELARDHGLALSREQSDRLALQQAGAFTRAARDFGDGFAHSDMRSGAAVSGAIVADLSGFGDVRDLVREGGKWMQGQDADALVLGLSAVGLAITAATFSSLGAGLPIRAGLSLTKALQKTGRLSQPLARGLSRVAGEALDREALNASLAAAARLDFTAARSLSARLLRPAAMTELRQVGADVSTLYTRAGARSAQEVLSLAASSTELRAGARLAAAKGSKTRAILKVFGRGVLMAGSLGLVLAGWLLTLVGWFFAAASCARRLGERIGRKCFAARAATQKPVGASR